MLFPTIDFALFFAGSFALVWSLNNQNLLKKLVLLALSLLFYASWDWHFVFLILASGAISYLGGLYVDAAHSRPFRRAVLTLCIALDLGILVYFKYLNFLVAQILNFAHMVSLDPGLAFVNVTLPVAISFLTFHAISYVVDVYRGRVSASRSPLDVMLYLSFFPHLVAGPIVRAHEFLPQLQRPGRTGDFSLGENLLLILGGLFKKMVIANYIAVRFVDPVFTDPSQFARFDLIVATYAYAIQIYCDFSAYTDIAIGVAALFGYRFPQNFNQPYRALGFSDFWRRWHMTLSVWLRDYLYIPLGGNRHGEWATTRNLMITMLLGGLWHGANWTFLIWGAMHGLALTADHRWQRSKAYAKLSGAGAYQAIAWIVTFHFVCFTWIFFRSASLDDALQFLSGVWTDNGADVTAPWIVAPLLLAGAVTHLMPEATRRIAGAAFDRQGMPAQIALGFAALYVILVMAPAASAPFIYFRF
ncbi:MBOAT family protein [Methylocapsa sp. S129]|uniref:MBOAT family O-acyltransferase n=1 Tax=Methylocapsa sp. S129 TaxID=1641869 RepID=UPI00131E6B1F|nr:MBOAT family O-acyltransferase [Methylocapsa sp. S129]